MSGLSDHELRQVDDAFERALSLPKADRDSVLDGLSAVQRQRVYRLLALAEDDDEALPLPFPKPVPEPAPVSRLGPWSVMGELGRGGMSVVYRGERDDGVFRQQVALKLMPFSDEDLAVRFRRERQLLADLSHPGIARLLDGGSDALGRPFLVLELIDGLRIDDHCDQRRLDVRQRLQLFVEVAEALEYAHSRLVVHRDIKPSNVLVTHEGRVKLLDFGIAALLDAAGARAATSAHLTPDYASPEQLAGQPVSTASDVYQLGLILVVLLLGDVRVGRRVSFAPVAPSEALNDERVDAREVAERRHSTPAALRRTYQGDLDAVVLKALAVEPSQRYPSVAALRRDVQAVLTGQPVSAAKTSPWHWLRRQLQHHPIRTVAALAAITGLMAWALTSTLQSRRLAAEQRRAEAVKSFALSLFTASNPGNARGTPLTARELLDRGLLRVDDTLRDDPLLRAEMLETLADTYQTLGQLEAAAPLYETVIVTRRAEGRRDALARTLRKLGLLRHYQASYVEADALLREALALHEEEDALDTEAGALTQNELASLLHTWGHDELGEPFARAAVATLLTHSKPEAHAIPLRILAQIRQARGDLEEAEGLLRASKKTTLETSGDDDPILILTRVSLAEVLAARGKPGEAADESERAARWAQHTYQPDHPMRAIARKGQADVAWARGDVELARVAYREAAEGIDRWNPRPSGFGALAWLGVARTEPDPLEARRLVEQVLQQLHAGHLTHHPAYRQATAQLEALPATRP